MRAGSYLVSGLIGGVIGAVAWAAIAYLTGYEFAWIAWVVGMLVGASVRFGAQQTTGFFVGLSSAAIAIAAIVAGKAAVVFLSLEMTEALPVAFVADEIVAERESAGKQTEWKGIYVTEETHIAELYPFEVWEEAAVRWETMSQAQRAPFNDAATETYKAAFFAMLESRFGVFDYFWFAIGIATAFRLGAGFEDDEEYLVPDTPLGLPNPGRKGRVEESAKPRVRRKADDDPDEGNNFFRAMRPAEDDDLPSMSGAGEARSEAA